MLDIQKLACPGKFFIAKLVIKMSSAKAVLMVPLVPQMLLMLLMPLVPLVPMVPMVRIVQSVVASFHTEPES